jgi:hypothetical protein
VNKLTGKLVGRARCGATPSAQAADLTSANAYSPSGSVKIIYNEIDPATTKPYYTQMYLSWAGLSGTVNPSVPDILNLQGSITKGVGQGLGVNWNMIMDPSSTQFPHNDVTLFNKCNDSTSANVSVAKFWIADGLSDNSNTADGLTATVAGSQLTQLTNTIATQQAQIATQQTQITNQQTEIAVLQGTVVGSPCQKGSVAGTIHDSVDATTGAITFTCIVNAQPIHLTYEGTLASQNGFTASFTGASYGGGPCATSGITDGCDDSTSFAAGDTIHMQLFDPCGTACTKNQLNIGVTINGVLSTPIECDRNPSPLFPNFNCVGDVATTSATTSVDISVNVILPF